MNTLKELVRSLSFRTSDFPTKRRWLQMVFRSELHSAAVTEMTLRGAPNLRFRIAPGSVIGHEVLLHGLYEKDVAKRFLKTVTPGDLVLDIGANLGQYTLLASRAVGPKGQVISIEPVPHVFQRLQEHLLLNNVSNVTAVQAALGREQGTVRMAVISDENDGLHHVSPAGSDRNTVSVPMRTLDDVLEEFAPGRDANVIKIDVEGWEEAVFAGGKRIFAQPRMPVIFFESLEVHAARYGFSSEKLRRQFESAGTGMDIEGFFERRRRAGRWRTLRGSDAAPENCVAVPRQR